jgi:hypothetical protein
VHRPPEPLFVRLRAHIPVPRTSARDPQKPPPAASQEEPKKNPRRTRQEPTRTQERPAAGVPCPSTLVLSRSPASFWTAPTPVPRGSCIMEEKSNLGSGRKPTFLLVAGA